jgi:phosphatidylinositol-3-phosphatase
MGADVAPYVKHHNPFVYLTDVIDNPQGINVVPFSQFAADLSVGTLPNYSFIVPNLMDDAHDGSLAAADQWLQANIDPLIKNPSFQSDGLLIITFDEGSGSDSAHGGGQVPFVLVGPRVKKAFQSSTFYQHESTLRLILQSLGVNSFPGASAGAPKMGEFFQ